MQKFEYRSPRFEVDLPVRMTLPNSTIPGRCIEISREGMRVEFLHPISSGVCGSLSLQYRDISLQLRVRVARTASNSEGLEILFESDRDRKAMEHLIALLTAASPRVGPTLVR